MSSSRLSLLEILTPDHRCGAAVDRRSFLCWHLYGRRADGSPFAVATRSDSSIGAQVRVRDEIEGAFFERVIVGFGERQSAPAVDYR
jgi:hypothetical protein